MTRDEAAAALRAGDAAGAVAMIRPLLAVDPANDDLLGLLGVALEAQGEFAQAEVALRRALELTTHSGHALRYAGNLCLLLLDAGRNAEAEAVIDQRAWRFIPAGEGAAAFTPAAVNLALVMQELERDEARALLLGDVVASGVASAEVIAAHAPLLCKLGRTREAAALLTNYGSLLADWPERHAIAGYVASCNGSTDAAEAERDAHILAHPVYLSSKRGAGLPGIVMINPSVNADMLAEPPFQQHFGGNFPSQLARRMRDRYVFDSIFVEGGAQAAKLLPRDRPQICFNNMVNGEWLRTAGMAEKAQGVEDAIGLPVINAAAKAMRCTRQFNAEALQGIANLVTPKLRRYRKVAGQAEALARAVEPEFTYPVIVRGVFDQHGRNVFLAENRAELVEAINAVAGDDLYVIQRVDNLRFGKFFRKIRVAFVGGEPLVIRADYADMWMVHGRNEAGTKAVFSEKPELMHEVRDIILNPRNWLNDAAFDTLRAVGKTIPLDIFGLDCDFDESGRIFFFEANATMNFFPHPGRTYYYPPDGAERLESMIDQFLQARLAMA